MGNMYIDQQQHSVLLFYRCVAIVKVRLYGEHANVHQSHSQNDSGDLRGVARGDGELGCLCGKAGTSHLCDGSAHSSGCVVNGYGCRLSYY